MYSYAIVIFDHDGCGREGQSSQEIETEVERLLAIHGWENRAIALALDPELEIWVWSDSPYVSEALGWKGGQAKLVEWLIERKYVEKVSSKPKMPKEAMEELLRKSKKPRSSSIYMQLAQRVSFQKCIDPAFIKLKTTLQNWFPK